MGNGDSRVLGTVGAVSGSGVVRLEDRLDADVDTVWSALTEPDWLARWLGVIEGDLRAGGSFRATFFASGWEGTGRVEICEAPHRLLVTTAAEDEAGRTSTMEVTLTADAGRTALVFESRGMPPTLVAAYAAGNQIHVEDLASVLRGGERCDSRQRFGELYPAYQALPVLELG